MGDGAQPSLHFLELFLLLYQHPYTYMANGYILNMQHDEELYSTVMPSAADLIIVLPSKIECENGSRQGLQLTESAVELCYMLSCVGLTVKVYSSVVKQKFLYCALTISEEMLCEHACACVDVRFPMNPRALCSLYKTTNMPYDPLDSALEHIFLPYSPVWENKRMYLAVPGGLGVFQAHIRHAIVEQLMTCKKSIYHLENMQQKEAIIDAFPPHDEKFVSCVYSEAGGMLWFLSPFGAAVFRKKQLALLRDYLGKETAFYIVFLCHFIKCAAIPLFVYMVVRLFYRNIKEWSAFLGAAIPFWFILKHHFWQCKVLLCAVEWGIDASRKSQASKGPASPPWQLQLNPNFCDSVNNSHQIWPIPQEYKLPRSSLAQSIRMLQSVLLGIFAVTFLMFVLLLIFFAARSLFASLGFVSEVFIVIAPSCIHSAWIICLTNAIDGASECLTNIENQRTNIGFHRSLLAKHILWRILCFASPTLYIAFLQYRVEGSCHFAACSSLAGASALTAFVSMNLADMYAVYVSPYAAMLGRTQFLTRNQSSLKSLLNLSQNLILTPDAACDESESFKLSNTDHDCSPRQGDFSPSPAPFALEKEFLTLQKSSRPDKDWDDRSCRASHYYMQVNYVVNAFFIATFAGLAPDIILLAVILKSIEIWLVVASGLFVKRRVFGGFNAYPGIDDNVIAALQRVTTVASFLVPFYYLSSVDCPVQAIKDFSNITKIVMFSAYTWSKVLLERILNTLYPVISDEIALTRAKQEFVEQSLGCNAWGDEAAAAAVAANMSSDNRLGCHVGDTSPTTSDMANSTMESPPSPCAGTNKHLLKSYAEEGQSHPAGQVSRSAEHGRVTKTRSLAISSPRGSESTLEVRRNRQNLHSENLEISPITIEIDERTRQEWKNPFTFGSA